MNCKPDDLCIVLSNADTRAVGIDDKIIKVTRVSMRTGEPCWRYEGPFLRCSCGCGGVIYAIGDDYLRPIGTPGDDEQDETLAWTPVPVHAPTPMREAVPA